MTPTNIRSRGRTRTRSRTRVVTSGAEHRTPQKNNDDSTAARCQPRISGDKERAKSSQQLTKDTSFASLFNQPLVTQMDELHQRPRTRSRSRSRCTAAVAVQRKTPDSNSKSKSSAEIEQDLKLTLAGIHHRTVHPSPVPSFYGVPRNLPVQISSSPYSDLIPNLLPPNIASGSRNAVSNSRKRPGAIIPPIVTANHGKKSVVSSTVPQCFTHGARSEYTYSPNPKAAALRASSQSPQKAPRSLAMKRCLETILVPSSDDEDYDQSKPSTFSIDDHKELSQAASRYFARLPARRLPSKGDSKLNNYDIKELDIKSSSIDVQNISVALSPDTRSNDQHSNAVSDNLNEENEGIVDSEIMSQDSRISKTDVANNFTLSENESQEPEPGNLPDPGVIIAGSIMEVEGEDRLFELQNGELAIQTDANMEEIEQAKRMEAAEFKDLLTEDSSENEEFEDAAEELNVIEEPKNNGKKGENGKSRSWCPIV